MLLTINKFMVLAQYQIPSLYELLLETKIDWPIRYIVALIILQVILFASVSIYRNER